MRRRLLLTYVTLLAAVLVALELPLARSIASRETQNVFIDRLNDTARFASIAEEAVRTGRAHIVEPELRRYDELYGIAAVVVDGEGRVVARSRRDIPLTAPAVRTRLDDALSGERSGLGGVVWPWHDAPLVVAEPVGSGGEVIGAVVTLSPTNRLRARVLVGWLWLGAIGLLALALSGFSVVPLTRWLLRPVRDLDEAAHEITAGRLEARVRAASGPVELRRLALSFNVMADTVLDSLARQRAFVAQASHQLRNPLTALRLRVENLDEHLATEGHEEWQVAVDEAARLATILESLLSLARAESGRPGDIETVDAADVITERALAWQPVAQRREARLVVERPTGPIPVVCLRGSLDQAVDALVDNALKFGPRGGEVRLSAHRNADGTAEIHVRDEGPGLDDADRQQAAERFWRGNAGDNVEGSGLGLSIVAALLTASGGCLDLLPSAPHGLDARLTLRTPVAVDD